MNFDAERQSAEARLRKPLKTVMTERGDDPKGGEKWGAFCCPFCGGGKEKKKCASVFAGNRGHEVFFCRRTSCDQGRKPLDEAGYIAAKSGLSYRDGWIAWLKEAGVWKEFEATPPSVLPGQRARRRKAPAAPPDPNASMDSSPEKNLTGEPTLTEPVVDHGSESEPANAAAEDGSLTPQNEKNPIPPPPLLPEPIPPDGVNEPSGGVRPLGADAENPPDESGENESEPEPERVGGGGGGSGDGEGGDGDEDGEPTDGALAALREFYAKTILKESDRALLRTKRGSADETIDAMGVRSGRRENRAILMELGRKYRAADLIRCGLWRKGESGPKPSAQFYGFGLVGKLKKLKKAGSKLSNTARVFGDPGEEEVWDWTNPALIPYFNERGELIHLRPHKGGGKGVRARIYVPRNPASATGVERFEDVIVTEGEFKGQALWETLGAGASGKAYGIVVLPGIQQIKNPEIEDELSALLRKWGAKRVWVAYDNEDKENPTLASYQSNPRKRHDVEVWARYLAKWAGDHWMSGRVCRLPDEWRDEKGKADWDGALARAKREGWDAARIRKEFEGVIRAGRIWRESNQGNLFDDGKERIIRTALRQISYVPLLPYGGDREFKMARELRRLGRQLNGWVFKPHLMAMAQKYQEVIGWYYGHKPVRLDKERAGLLEKEIASCVERLNSPVLSEDEKKIARATLRFLITIKEKGLPDPVADFKMKCHFVMVKANGERVRMVTLRNAMGEQSELVELDAKSWTAARDFKCWTESHGGFTWMSGEGHLEALRHDTNQLTAFNEMYELCYFGWHEKAKFWLYGDGAIVDSADEDQPGKILFPDELGNLWHEGLGYRMGTRDVEGEVFKHGAPTLRLGYGLLIGEGGYHLAKDQPDDPNAVKTLLSELAFYLFETIGGPDAYLFLGSLFSYVAAPEFFRQEHHFPGVWLHGERGHGKSFICCMGAHVHGFRVSSGLNIPNATRVGMQIALQQYSNIPTWFEEVNTDTEASKIELLKATFNREPPPKKDFGEKPREIRTAPLVDGEATSVNSALRQRFPHILIARERRARQDPKNPESEPVEHRDWFLENKDFFLPWCGTCCGTGKSSSGWCWATGRNGAPARRCEGQNKDREAFTDWATPRSGQRRKLSEAFPASRSRNSSTGWSPTRSRAWRTCGKRSM